MDNVVEFTGLTKLDIPTERVLIGVLEVDLETVLVFGLGKDGGLYCASSTGDALILLGLLELGKYELLTIKGG